MKFVFFLSFAILVASFDFDTDDDKKSKDNVVFSTEIVATTVSSTVAVVPVFITMAATTTTTTRPTTTTTQPTTTTSTTSTTPDQGHFGREVPSFDTAEQGPLGRDFPWVIEEKTRSEKIEVIISQSMYRLIDEALRERLINFESRIMNCFTSSQTSKDQNRN